MSEETNSTNETPAETKATTKWWRSKKVMIGGSLAAAMLLFFVGGGILAAKIFGNEPEEIADTPLEEMRIELEAFKATEKKLRNEIAALKANGSLVTETTAGGKDTITRVEVAEDGTDVIKNVIDVSFKPRDIESETIIVTRQGVTVREYKFPGDNEWPDDLHTDFRMTSEFYEDDNFLNDDELRATLMQEVDTRIEALDGKMSARMNGIDTEIKSLKTGINGINQLLLERLPEGEPDLMTLEEVQEVLPVSGFTIEDLIREEVVGGGYEAVELSFEQYQAVRQMLDNAGLESTVERFQEALAFFKNAGIDLLDLAP